MNEEFRMNRLRLELTESQKEQIRHATGRTVNSLNLGLQAPPRPTEPPAPVTDPSPSPADR